MSQPIQRLIEAEAKAIVAFVGLLREEQEQLKAGETANLATFAAQKDSLIKELLEISGKREQALLASGLTNDSAGLAQWAASSGPAAQELLQRLLGLAGEARELNQLNGQLVALRLAHTRAALAALSPNATEPGLYGSSGQTTVPTGYRLIDSA